MRPAAITRCCSHPRPDDVEKFVAAFRETECLIKSNSSCCHGPVSGFAAGNDRQADDRADFLDVDLFDSPFATADRAS